MIEKEISVSLTDEMKDTKAKFILSESGEMIIEVNDNQAIVKIDDVLRGAAWLKSMGEV